MAKEIAKNENLSLWESLQATDPKYTKPFKGAGGFSGTAVNGTYILRRLTEAFGPCGKGWKFVVDDDRVEEGHTLKSGDKAKLHIVRGHIEYMSEAAWRVTSPQFGQTMLVGENRHGTFTDEEAPKKSITDCISKCAVLLGIAADVHLGMFDDSKYVNQRMREEAENPLGPREPEPAKPAAMTDKQAPANTTDDMTIARQVFHLVKGVAESAKNTRDIDDSLKHNGASLKILERCSPQNYDVLKGIVKDARERINRETMNDDMPEIEDMGRP